MGLRAIFKEKFLKKNSEKQWDIHILRGAEKSAPFFIYVEILIFKV